MDKKEAPLLYAYPLDDSTLNRAYAAATAFFAILGEWAILVITFSIALFFIPLTPAFTLHSTTASVLNVTGETENHFTANLGIEFLADDSSHMGSTIHYDSLRLSLFHHQQRLSTFSLLRSFQQHELTKTVTTEAKFDNVSLMVDEWSHTDHHGHGTSCGFVYLDLWFVANARYTQPMWPVVKDKLLAHCGELKVELCSSGTDNTTTTVVNSFLASCDVYSDVVHKVRVVLFVVLIFLLVTAVAVPFLVEHFFCSSMFS